MPIRYDRRATILSSACRNRGPDSSEGALSEGQAPPCQYRVVLGLLRLGVMRLGHHAQARLSEEPAG